jgi:O-antigen/teichoic acid export membrane protein
MEGLAGRVIRSGLWMVGLNVTGRLASLLRLFVLARLLTPQDFGLVGIALVVITLFDAFSATGISLALIQRQERARELYDTAWTLNALRGVLVTAVLVASAPAVGAFFDAPDGVAIVRALAVVPLLTGLANIAVVEFRKELAFDQHYVLSVSGVLADLCVAVPLAFVLANAWALVGGLIANGAVRLAMSYGLHPYRPRVRLDRRQARQLLGFGGWVFGSAAAWWLLTSGVQAVVGRLLGVQTMAFYQVAWRVALLPATEVSGVVSGVTVAAYAKLQESADRVRGAYLRVVTVVAGAAVPVTVAILVYGGDLVRVLLGPRWAPAGPIVRVLALFGAARAVGATSGPLFQGTGRPWLHTLAVVVELVVVAVLLWPLTLRFGAPGAAAAATIASLAGATAALWGVVRLLPCRPVALAPVFGWPAAACLPGVIARVGLGNASPSTVGLAAGLALFAALYLASLALLQRLGLYRLDPSMLRRLRRWRAAVRALRGAW